jgi:hypothetical protein
MTVGLAAALANAYLSVFRNTAAPAITTPFVKLHVGDPGAAGTANPSAVVTRNAITWAAPAGGSMALATLASFTMTTAETITHISLWDASTAGNFQQSVALTGSVPVISGSTLTFSALTLLFTPIAA